VEIIKLGSSNFLSTLKKAATVASDVLTTKGDLLSRSASALGRLPVSTNNFSLLCDSAQTLGIKWGASATSTLTTAGDLLYASGANTLARLAKGTDNQVLKMNGSSLNWETISAGVNNMEFVGFTEIADTSTTSITFGSLSYDMDADYTDMILLIGGDNTAGSLALEVILNQDTAGYRQEAILNDGGTLSGTSASGATEWEIAPTGLFPAAGYVYTGIIHFLLGTKSGAMHIESRLGVIGGGQQITDGDITIGDTITEVKLQVSTQSFGAGSWAALFARPMNS
jgi:hypothetical protein|tara:strand:+ start:49 stop:897 length:849 start_codon:yes stop_codon:yes gene_type:complete